MTSLLKPLWQGAVRQLKEAGVDTPVADARLLLQYILGMTHEELLMNPDMPVSTEQQERFQSVLHRRAGREPVARIIGRRAFWKSEFIVTPATLDPRMDSEILIEGALKHVASPPGKVLDLGTGTGCLLLSLLQEWPASAGVGIDISADAVAVAEENAKRLGLESRASFLSIGWESYTPARRFGVIVGNPPYIAENERASLPPDVRDFDPPQALFAGADGLSAYRQILARAPAWLEEGGWLLLEIGHSQAAAVAALVEKAGLRLRETRQDLAGLDRVLIAQKEA